jgi:hypothetical protein
MILLKSLLKEIFDIKAGILSEASLRGEWWIQDGQSIFADGDVGDMNHEAIVQDSLRRQILGHFGIDVEDEYVGDFDDYAEQIFEVIGNKLNPTELEDWREEQYLSVIRSYFKRADSEMLKKMEYAYGSGDARKYALIHWGWQRMKQNTIQTQTLTPKDMKNISNGVWEAYESELENTDPEEVSETNPNGEHTFDIEVMSTRSWYQGIPWSVLEKASSTSLNPYRTRYE